MLQRSATKARTQTLNQLRALLVNAAVELRAKLRDLTQRQLLQTCAGFRVATDDSWRHSRVQQLVGDLVAI